VADLNLLPKPESPSAASDWAIRVSIAVPYFLIGLGKFSSSPDSVDPVNRTSSTDPVGTSRFAAFQESRYRSSCWEVISRIRQNSAESDSEIDGQLPMILLLFIL
jgi:hypothetical protein